MDEKDWTGILGWPGYKVYRHERNEGTKELKLWVRRKRGNKHLVCSTCGKQVAEIVETYEREVRDLPWSDYKVTVVVELYRVRCPDDGVRAEKVLVLPSNAPFSKRFEEAVGQACENAAASRVAAQFGLPASTVRAIDQRYLERWASTRKKPALREMGVDEIYLGRKQKFVTVVSNLEAGEPVWFGAERKKETLDEFFRTQLSGFQRSKLRGACVDMWEPFRLSIEQWAPKCKIVYDKFHIMQHAGNAIDEVRRAEFFRQGGPARDLVKGKRWLLLTHWGNLTEHKRQQLSELLAVNRRLFKAYLGVGSALQTLCCRSPSGHRLVPLVGARHAVSSSQYELPCVAGVSPDVLRWRFAGDLQAISAAAVRSDNTRRPHDARRPTQR